MAEGRNKLRILILLFVHLLFISCGSDKNETRDNTDGNTSTNTKITFIELGSVNCIPCRQMQPIMKSIEEKYKGQVKVVFHDVWKDKAPAQKYGIQLIPTQVFLDENGTEFFRHEGFYPEEDIIKLFETKGIKPLNN